VWCTYGPHKNPMCHCTSHCNSNKLWNGYLNYRLWNKQILISYDWAHNNLHTLHCLRLSSWYIVSTHHCRLTFTSTSSLCCLLGYRSEGVVLPAKLLQNFEHDEFVLSLKIINNETWSNTTNERKCTWMNNIFQHFAIYINHVRGTQPNWLHRIT
jgi:hypothetical protein